MTAAVWILLATAPFAAVAWTAGVLVDRLAVDAGTRARLWTLLFAAPLLAAGAAPGLALLLPEETAALVPLSGWSPALAEQTAAAASTAGTAWRRLLDGTPSLILTVAAVGAALRLGRLAMLHARLARRMRQAEPADREGLAKATAQAAAAQGLRAPAIAWSDGLSSPLLAGLRRPMILLPAGLATLPDDQLAAVCAHELAHLKRADNLRGLAEDLVLALLWFNPIQTALHRRLIAAREEVCDRDALAGASPATRRAYAELLVDALRLGAGRPLATSLTGTGRSPQIMRLKAILTPAPASPRAKGVALVAGLAAVCALATGTAALAGRLQDEPFRTVSKVAADEADPHASVQISADRAEIIMGERTRWSGNPRLTFVGDPEKAGLRILLDGKTPPAGFRADRVDPKTLRWIDGYPADSGRPAVVDLVTVGGAP
ncbi:M56 family metallopeptidase [Caulobacter mirabilis]|uniref:Peptidase M56 domain-containing protein n=1 Tax=Caulobacter mirabilis TaxID=69666 RepID=A0A2D2AYP5_9CAUL|nr:M56 family metallopeptidase [Caulobacter mirabilis]ATQ43047.1 hypothetical protein CSW64_11810 [Caulobacter mirabilis]